jgi:hypothetical protein
MATDNRTLNRDYRLPNAANKMKSEDLPRLILSLEMLDADMATVIAEILGKADDDHVHEMGEITGLVSALSGKAALVHTHNIGTLGGVDFSGATAGQFVRYNGTIWVPAAITTADLADKIITSAKLRDSAALSILGRAGTSVGSPGDISATTNDRLLARVSDALAFVQLTLGMVPDNLLTFAKLVSTAIASQAEAEAGAVANKLMTPLQTAQAIAALSSTQAAKVTAFTAGGTYTKDAKAKFVFVQVQGGGGGGGGAKASSGANQGIGGLGSPGAYAEAWFTAANVSATETITVGAAGSAGSSSPTDGGDGGQSSFGTKVVAPGGSGGAGANSTGGAVTGANGAPASAPSFTGTSFGRLLHIGATSTNQSGFLRPDNSHFGISGTQVSAGSGAGTAGSGYGAAGGGGRYSNNGSNAGGAGGAGVVIITEIF